MKGNKEDGNFVIFENYKEYFENLSGEQVKLLMLSLFEFAKNDNIIKHNDLVLDMILKTMTDNMIIGSKRRIASIENGKKGGRPKQEDKKINELNNNDNNDNKKEEIEIFFEELKNILSKNYSGSISTRINSKNSKLILSKLLNKKDIVINGYKNYIEFNKNNNTELKYIKSLEVFLRNEVYEDYKELEPKTKKDNINILTANEEW
jgi:hypothetical protein